MHQSETILLVIVVFSCISFIQSKVDFTADNGEDGKCEIYNGTACSEFLRGKIIYIDKYKPLHRQEKKLKRWFKENKESRQISRECWRHAKALTCRKFYPECDVERNEPNTKSLCASHCSYVREICKGEYKRTLHSKYYQAYIPLCKEETLFRNDYCWKLPTYDPSKGPILYAEQKKHIRKESGKQAILKCSFGISNFLWNHQNKEMIREGTWLRNGKRVITNRKFSIKTKSKGKARLFMLLRIRKATLKDKGEYECEVTFGNYTVRSGARLTITNPRVIPVVIPNKKSDTKNSNNIQAEVPGKCLPYNGDVCSAYFRGGTVIFERKNQPLNMLNEQLKNVIDILKKTKKLSKKCEEFGQAVLCFHKFPRCDTKTRRPVQSLCKIDCELFRNDYCRDELAMVQQDRMTMDLFIPQCNKLPENNKGCIPISNLNKASTHAPKPTTKNEIHTEVNEAISCYDEDSDQNYIGTLSIDGDGKFCDEWSKYTGYERIKHDHCRNFNEAKPWCFVDNKKKFCNIKSCRNSGTPPCYANNGEDYLGKVSVSKTGRKCLKWSTVSAQYSDFNNDYCRNLGDDMESPWCFVDKNTKEICGIPKCTVVTPPCYKGNGEDYLGKLSVSKTGRKCLQWNIVTLRYSNVDNSYCRNFEKDMKSPWCFVDQNTKELCDIPKCMESDRNTEESISLVAYVVPSIVGSSVLLFSCFLLAFYVKNKKLITEKRSQEAVGLQEEESDKDADSPKMNTLSTNASYDYNKDPPPSTVSPVFHFNTPPLEIKSSKRYKKSVPEVKEVALKNLVKIGDGKLGQLWQGDYYQSRERIIPVLVRKLRADTRSCVGSDFRQEMNSLRSLRHVNIEQIVCVSAMSEVPFMAFDGNHKMDLKEYIFDDETINNDFLIDCVYQITSGLDYLHQQKVLHKDLAARNCFITPEGTVYISKSGLGMYRYPNDYKNLPGHGLCPIRWLSPETLQTSVYRISTDIYMLGVVIWELFSRGERPFTELCDEDVIQEILNGNKLICPAACPVPVWNIVEQCWVMPGCQRPPAFMVKQSFRRLTELNNSVSSA